MSGILTGIHYKTEQPITLEIKSGLIEKISAASDFKPNRFIAPGLVDLQINGFKGVDFNESGLNEDKVLEITQELFKEGVTGYFPTLITNSAEAISNTLKILLQSCTECQIINESLLGIHLEGPFLSAEDGPRGAHPLQYIQNPDWELFCKWQEISQGKIRIITLAPELPGAISFIKKCVAAGVTVAIGHTAASPEQIQEAVKAGARFSTHLGNASHLVLPRHSNYIWEQLASEDLWATLIADGFHLPESLLSVLLKVKQNKSILVSDATKFAGLPPGSYQSHIGGSVELAENGRLSMKGSPKMLAGSARSLLDCVDHLISTKLETTVSVFDMASLRPNELLDNTKRCGLKEGNIADLIVFERNSGITKIIQTVKFGEVVYSL
ncbi:N-acetylglucosamine-6-phosphate deacetylase [Leeuwenhoekiella polynyae]|uniref:N-acetylglucosamine-6-phosphate deacetylase n=1 Tax=Leeuwenhoekiella polynyae TaxID=1550906 RepID=A0A4Q0PGK0_9FLAO|nr:amidohydrolase family protein [Leeuwenhoekiella polynyae]RXG26099.1 N-acetylglucosamine-6-phosphate deacetylase [Leeuwenhoekiella polynyae]